MLGTIALDIDGTLTADSRLHTMPLRVVKYLSGLVQAGWNLIFITGRTFQASYKILAPLPFNYYLAVQNGAIILEMPSRRILSKKYLSCSIIEGMDQICQKGPSDFVVYAGMEYQDECYYRPERFSKILRDYLKERVLNFKETWHPVESFDEMNIEAFPSVKGFGPFDSASQLSKQIESQLKLHAPLIKDPFDERYYVVQATHPEINKGQALLDLLAIVGREGVLIAAGDDLNDIPMLNVADIKIVMTDAPQELIQLADIVAPSATEEGIIVGLEAALKW